MAALPARRTLVILLAGVLLALSGCVTGETDDGADVESTDANDSVDEPDDEQPAEEDRSETPDEDEQEDRPPPEDANDDEETETLAEDGDDEADTESAQTGDDSTEEADDEDATDGHDYEEDTAADDDTEADEDETDADGDSVDAPQPASLNDSDDATVASQTTLEGTVELHHLDVGQADATIILTPTDTIVIDTGDWWDDGQTVIEHLEALGVERIDHLIGTHPHADHIGGHAGVIEHFETNRDGVGAVYDSGIAHTSQTYENYLDAVAAHDVTLFEVQEGDSLPVDVGTGTVLNPPTEKTDDMHYNSVAILFEFGEHRYLTTGDVEEAGEARLVDDWAESLDADIYHAGHHGSSTSSTPDFMDAVTPEVAIISSALDSQYGHPHDLVLDRFSDRAIETYWTGAHGDIVITLESEQRTIETDRGYSTDPSDLQAIKDAGELPEEPDEVDVSDALEVSEYTVDGPVEEESITLTNTGSETIDLGGWELHDRAEDGQVAGRLSAFEFPADFELEAGASVTIWTAEGENTDTDLYWGYGTHMWRADGDVIRLLDPDGTVVLAHPYGDQA